VSEQPVVDEGTRMVYSAQPTFSQPASTFSQPASTFSQPDQTFSQNAPFLRVFESEALHCKYVSEKPPLVVVEDRYFAVKMQVPSARMQELSARMQVLSVRMQVHSARMFDIL
jgi:hypothetical protein